MAQERYPRGNSLQGDYYARGDDDYAPDYGSGRAYTYTSARDYEAAGMIGPRRGDDRYRDRGDFDRGYYSQGRNAGYANRGYNYGDTNRGSYASDAHRFTDNGDRREDYRRDRDYARSDMYRARRDQGRDPRDYSYEDRDFFARAGDEVRSWFGDEDAERRRQADQRYDERYGRDVAGYRGDGDYHSWRAGQIAALDRDYDEYRRENQQKFSNEFGSWRNERQTQRSSLSRVTEHMDVVGSDGEHIGTVDKVRGDRILLTKSDPDAGGRHHSIPSRWIDRVDDKVTVRKTADEAKAHWRDEERSAFFGGDSVGRGQEEDGDGRMLNRSFSGTY